MSCVSPAKFAHIVYRTRRFDEMLHWYKTVFDARVQYQNPALAFLTYDDEHHRFLLADMSVIQPGGTELDKNDSIGVDHVAYTHASIGELLENYAYLKESGIAPYWCVHHGITASMYYADPDGNQMEFQVDCLGSSAEASAFMKSHFDTNPIGVEYDPEEWLARFRAGTPDTELMAFDHHGPVSPIRGAFESFM